LLDADDATPDIQDKIISAIPQNTAQTQLGVFDGDTVAPKMFALRATAETFKSFMINDGTTKRLASSWYPRLNDTIFLMSNAVGNFNEVGRLHRGPVRQIFLIDSQLEGFNVVGNHNTFPLDDNATVVNLLYEVVTPFTSAGNLATVGLSIDTDDPAGLKAPIVVTDPTLATGWHRGIPNIETPASFSNKTTLAGRRITFDVAVENLLSGAMWVLVDYMITT
jgi:hypothetical protein